MLPQKLAFVDIETTGARPNSDRVLEIGILRVENNKLVATYKSLFNPHAYISPFIENLTGISQKDVEDAPSFREELRNIIEVLEGCTFVAHNVRFDYGFLRNELKRYEVSFSAKHLDTVRLSQLLYPQFNRHDLDHIISRFNIDVQSRHRAFDDAKVLWEFYQKIQQEFPEERLTTMVDLAMKRPSRPLHLSEAQLDELPESPGVYLFYADGPTPLYIGKSVNIRERVLSHFTNDALSGTDMQLSQQVKRIEHIVTGGELSALFKESTLIKKMQPLYNRKLRLSRKLTVIKKILTPEGYFSAKIDTVSNIDSEDSENILAVAKSKKQATNTLLDLAKEFSLCQKLLDIEKTRSGCFSYRLGWCKGACVGKEKPAFYNIRFLSAFERSRIRPWPFQGPILIEEKNNMDDIKEVYVIDKWCVLGSFRSDTDLEDFTKTEYIFDVDTYKILKTFLKSPRNLMKIKELSNTQYKSLQNLY